jgi:hypothetical protein
MVAARKATQVAKSIKAQATDSTIAKLPETTNTATVRAAKPVALKTGNNFTGQYLYERFVMDKAEQKADVTKMGIVQQMVEVLDANEFAVTVDGMVGFANRDYKAAVEAAKAAGNYDSENPTWPIREASARLRTARNHKTVMQNAFGALKFCADELKAKMGEGELSYRMIREIGSKLLSDKGINWKGEKVIAPADRQAKREQDTETAAMTAIQKEHPRQPGESLGQYFTRMEGEVTKRMAKIKEDERIKNIASLAEKIRNMCGGELPEVLDVLLSGPEPVGEQVAESKTKAKDVPVAKADKNLH